MPERRPGAWEISSFCHLRSIKTILDPRLEACVWQQQGMSLGFFDFKIQLAGGFAESGVCGWSTDIRGAHTLPASVSVSLRVPSVASEQATLHHLE